MTGKKLYHWVDRGFTGLLYLIAMFFISSWTDDPSHGWALFADVVVAAITIQWAVERSIRHARDDVEDKLPEDEEMDR